MSLLTPPDGVPVSAWTKIARAEGTRWAVAERNAVGEIVGTTYRHVDGRKECASGGKRGLILAWPLNSYSGTSALEPIFVCEGASDTAALLGLGLESVGVPMAGACGDMLAELLADRHVVLVADADEAGRRGTARLADALLPRCLSVRVIDPPKGSKDAREAVIAGADRTAFHELARGAASLARVVAPTDGDPVMVRMSDITPREVDWLWEGRIPRGRLSILAGRPGEGKSMLSMDIAARVTTGRAWPDGRPCAVGSVILVSGEDDAHDTIRPRLDAHGADAARVHLLRSKLRVRQDGMESEQLFTLKDVKTLEVALGRVTDPALVIVDPIGSFIGGGVDANRDNEVRGVLAPLADLARRTGAAFLLVAHQRKGEAAHADDLVLGSRAFTGVARSVMHLLPDPDDDSRRLLLPGKMNLARSAAGLAFTIVGSPPRIEWEPDPIPMNADDVLAARTQREHTRRTKREEATEWLRDFLSRGPVPAQEVIAESKSAGLSVRTLERAKRAAGVHTQKEAFGGGWVWSLSSSSQDRQVHAEDCQTPSGGGLGMNPGESCENLTKIATSEELATFGALSGNLGTANHGHRISAEIAMPVHPGSAELPEVCEETAVEHR